MMTPVPNPIGTTVDAEHAIAGIVEDPACHFLPVPKCVYTDGFSVGYNQGNSLFCCMRDAVAQEHRVPGRLWHWFPKTGRYHIGFVLVDNTGSPYAFDFVVQQRPMFRVTTSRLDGLRHIYFTEQAYDLQFAQTFELRFAGDGTPQAVEGLVFLPVPLAESLAPYQSPITVTAGWPAVNGASAEGFAELHLCNPGKLPLNHELLRFPLPPAMADLATVRTGPTALPFHLRRIGNHPDHPNLQLELLEPAAGGQSRRLTLARGATAEPAVSPLQCAVNEQAAVITDGPSQWRLIAGQGKISIALADRRVELQAILEGAAGPLPVTRTTIREVYASPLLVEVECAFTCTDPVDATFAVQHATLLRFVQGAERIELEHRLENHSKSPFIYLKRYGVRISTHGELSAVTEAGLLQPIAAFDVFRHTDREVCRTIDGLPEKMPAVDHAVMSGTCLCTLGDFANSAPVRLRAGHGTIDLELLPAAAAVHLDPDEEYRFRNQFFIENGTYKLREGMARRHTSSLCWLSHPAPAVVRAEILRLDHPPYLHSPAVFTGAHLVPNPCFAKKAITRRAADSWLAQWQEFETVTRPWDFFSGGDWFGERVNNWGNNEYDTPFGAFQVFLATGNAEWRRRGIAAARHQMDVDTCHGEHPDGGWQIAHSLAHGGNYFPDEYRVGAKNAGVGVAHVWVEGMLLDYWLTGDTRARDVATRLLDDLAGPKLVNWRMVYERDAGWHLVHLCAGAAILQEERYLDAARRLVLGILERQRRDGSFRRVLSSDHCGCYPKHTGCVSFMVGILLAGLRRYHLLTGDATVRQAIIRLADYLMRDIWDDNLNGFRYTSCPQSKPFGPVQMIEGLAYAAQLSGDAAARQRWAAAYRRELAEQFPPEMVRHQRVYGEPVFGNSFTMRLRLFGPVGYDLFQKKR